MAITAMRLPAKSVSVRAIRGVFIAFTAFAATPAPRVLSYLRSLVQDAAWRRRYLHFKATMMALAQGSAVVLGLFMATRGHLLLAVAIWGIAAGGATCTRALHRL